MATVKRATENWATGKLGNEKRRRRKKRQHLCNRGKNGNGKIGQRKKGQPENCILE